MRHRGDPIGESFHAAAGKRIFPGAMPDSAENRNFWEFR
jgi:hypothetical protein